jgi:response regulator RpfG family c-di-GMP phosphodiesterase
MKTTEYLAQNIRMNTVMLAYNYDKTLEDKREWQPKTDDSSKTRSAKEQMEEVVSTLESTIQALRTRRGANTETTKQEGDSLTEQVRKLGDELAEEVAKMSDEDLGASLRGPGGHEQPAIRAVTMVTANVVYHLGQVAFIQTLYGDTEFHVPPEMLS